MNCKVSAALFLLIYSFTASASVTKYATIHANGQTGLYDCYSANTLGFTRLVVNVAGDFAYDPGFISEMDKIINRVDEPEAIMYGFYPALGFGVTSFLDFSLVQPIYFDIIPGWLPSGGSGDLTMALKCRVPGSKPRWAEGALYTDLTFPNGNKNEGYFMRHNYYQSKELVYDSVAMVVPSTFFSSKKPTWEIRLLGTFGNQTVNGHLNLGTRITFDGALDNVFTAGAGVEFNPTDWFGAFADLFMEPRYQSLKDGFKINRDPFHISPGITLRAPGGTAVSIGASFNLSSNSLKIYEINREGTDPFKLHTRTEPLWRIFVRLGWNGALLSHDKDSDMVPDRDDKCPEVAEDIDGFEDQDGCPDRDNDADKIPDTVDACRDIPEDVDGTSDEDGCPDFDNDEDGIPDSLDGCVDMPEDRDGFNDEDGCPDMDNDSDGIADTSDKCMGTREDLDGFEDNDGCPDTDNDKDAIPDSIDNCPDSAGTEENQGCPTPKEKAKEIKFGRLILSGVYFEGGSADLTLGSAKDLDRVYQSLADWPEVKIEIRAHTDNSASAQVSLELSQQRADVVRDYLVNMGIDPARLTSIGKGSVEPIAENTSVQGRRLNNRIEIHRTE